MKSNGRQRLCDNCGKPGARIIRVPRTYGKGRSLFVIENVPVISCPNCGESYLSAQTLHELERIKQDRKHLAEEKRVRVASFASSKR